MPLRDHFRSPVNDSHSWDEAHGQWPGEMVRHLATILPQGYRAGPNIHLGSSLEVDVGSLELDAHTPAESPAGDGGGVATRTTFTPTHTLEAQMGDEDEYEVRLYDTERGRTLVAAIEIVSPSNKDRPESRAIFLGKVTALLKQSVCVTIVDLVTVRLANFFAELLGPAGAQLGTPPSPIYAVTLRTRKPPKRRLRLDAWFYPMTVGEPLPTVPIWLTSELRIMLPLETSYQETCRILGIP